MFDGIKIFCSVRDPNQWLGHPDLDFGLTVSAKTGEVLPEPIRAKFRELLFKISPSRSEPGGHWLQVSGSLHRYANGGTANVGDFTHADLCRTVADLCQRFGIEAKAARLENVEFGLNLRLSVPVRDFLAGCVVHVGEKSYRQFSNLNEDRATLGKMAIRQFYTVKLYDKGKQAGTGEADVLRLEVAVSKMEFLKPYRVATLADLCDPVRVADLGDVLQRVFAGVLCYDGSIKPKTLSEREQLFLEQCKNPLFWLNLDKDRRYYLRGKFDEMMARNFCNIAYRNALQKVAETWRRMLGDAQKKCDQLTDFPAGEAQINSDILTVRMKGWNVGIDGNYHNNINGSKICDSSPENGPAAPPGTVPDKRSFFRFGEPRFCGCCGRDISAQRPGSLFCSERVFGKAARRCRDAAHNDRRRAAVGIEAAQLADLLPGVLAAASLTVFAFDLLDTAPRPALVPMAHGTPADFAGTAFRGIRRAVRVDVLTADSVAVVLTRARAKSLLRHLARLEPSPTMAAPRPSVGAAPVEADPLADWLARTLADIAPPSGTGQAADVPPVIEAGQLADLLAAVLDVPTDAPTAAPTVEAAPPSASVRPTAEPPPVPPRNGAALLGDIAHDILSQIKKS